MSARRRPPLPSWLRVGAKRYTVHRSDSLTERAELNLGEVLAGYSDSSQAEIVIREGTPHETEAETLLHEVLHQCLRASGCWPDDIRPGRGGLSVEEQVVAAMAPPLLGVLRDHPELVKFLTHADTP